MNDSKDDDQVKNEIKGASAPSGSSKKQALKKNNFGSILGDLVGYLAPQGLPPDVANIVILCIRHGFTENDPLWSMYLPLLLRQVTPESMAVQLEAFIGAVINKMPEPKASRAPRAPKEFDSDEVLKTFNTMRAEFKKLPGLITGRIKPDVIEAVSDAMDAAPNKTRVVIDDSKLMFAVKEALVNGYFVAAIGIGLALSALTYFVGSKFG